MEAALAHRIWNRGLARAFSQTRTPGRPGSALQKLGPFGGRHSHIERLLSVLSTTAINNSGNLPYPPSSPLLLSSYEKPIAPASRSQRRPIAMSAQLIPSNPADVLVIRDLTPNVTILSLPFLRVGLFEVGGRCTIVRMTSGGVLVFSPVALIPEVAAVVSRLDGGQGVKYLVAPDIEHHIFLSEWRQAYPEARVIAPDGLAEKRATTQGKDPKVQCPEDAFFAVLPDGQKGPVRAVPTIAPDFDADFAAVYFDTHPNKEIVLVYKPDRVLIEADLFFNLPAVEQYARVDPAARRGGPDHPDFLNRLFQSIMTASGAALAARRFMWYAVSRKNRGRFNEGVQVVDSWSFDTVIPCHGEVIEGNGKEVFRKLFAWHLPSSKGN